MKTLQIKLDDELAAAVDAAVQRLGQTRSGFARQALRQALTRLEIQEQERRHRQGYIDQPVADGEFSDFEDEQVWGNE